MTTTFQDYTKQMAAEEMAKFCNRQGIEPCDLLFQMFLANLSYHQEHRLGETEWNRYQQCYALLDARFKEERDVPKPGELIKIVGKVKTEADNNHFFCSFDPDENWELRPDGTTRRVYNEARVFHNIYRTGNGAWTVCTQPSAPHLWWDEQGVLSAQSSGGYWHNVPTTEVAFLDVQVAWYWFWGAGARGNGGLYLAVPTKRWQLLKADDSFY